MDDSYTSACRDYDERWRLLDQTLYDLCSSHPGHTAADGVYAKLWIIGRTYATGIERKVASAGAQGSSLSVVADHLHSQAETVDTIFSSILGMQEPLDVDKLALIATTHGRLVQLLQQITIRRQSPRSFASKYLHFHCPTVPIYDSYAAVNLGRLYRLRHVTSPFESSAEADAAYVWYLARFWKLYDEVRSRAPMVSVKLVDHYLLSSSFAE